MANLVITEVIGKTYFKADFGVYAGVNGVPEYKYFWADDILEVDCFSDRVIVELKETKADEWNITTSAHAGSMIVDSVLGDVPADIHDLTTLIANLKG